MTIDSLWPTRFSPDHTPDKATPENALQTGLDLHVSVDGRDVHIVTSQLDDVNGHGLNRRHAKWTAGSNIEAGPMTGALDLATDQFPLGEGATVVGADIVDRVQSAVDIEYGDGTAVDFDQLFTPRWELVTGRNFYR
jgi:hypothetical protein